VVRRVFCWSGREYIINFIGMILKELVLAGAKTAIDEVYKM
jgi:hypothetical protein